MRKMNIVLSDSSPWIVRRLSDHLIKYIPEMRIYPYDNSKLWRPNGILDSADLNYYMVYHGFRRLTNAIDVGFFTHPDPKDPEKSYQHIKGIDFVVSLSPKYQRKLDKRGFRSICILPGIDESCKPKLVLGFIGRFEGYGWRKGQDILEKVSKLDFVKLEYTLGKIPEEKLSEFYNSLDYVLVTSRVEGGPMSILEGIACGKKVICPLDVGIAEMFPKNIISFRNGDFDDLLRVLRRLYQKKLEIAMSVREYTWERWGLKHQELFEQLLRGN